MILHAPKPDMSLYNNASAVTEDPSGDQNMAATPGFAQIDINRNAGNRTCDYHHREGSILRCFSTMLRLITESAMSFTENVPVVQVSDPEQK